MAIKKVIEIDIENNIDETRYKLNELNLTIETTTKELESLKEGTEQYSQANNRLENAKNKFDELSNSANTTTSSLKNVGNTTEKVSGVLQGASDVAKAFGVNNDLLSSSLDLVSKFQVVQNVLGKEGAKIIGAQSVATAIQTGLQYAYTTAVGTTTGALKLLKIALISTGIGAIVVLLGSLVSALADSTEATEEQKKAQDNLNESLDRTNELYKESLDSLKDVTKERILRAKIAGKGEQELLKIEKDSREERRKLYEQERDDLLRQLNQKNIGLENSKKINKQLSLIQKEYFNDLESDRKKDLERELEVADQQREAEAKKLEEQRKAYKKRREELAKQRYQELLDFLDFQKKINLADLEQINLKIEKRFNQDQNLLDGTQLAIEQLDNEDKKRTDKEKAQSDARKLILKLELQARENQVAGIASALSDLASIAGESTGVGKGLAVASTLISTYSSAQKAYESAFLPIPTPASPALGAVFAGVAVASGLANVKKILSVKAPNLKGGGGSAGASASAPSVASAPPSFNIVGNAGTNQIASTIGARQAEPIRAYVVSTQITTAQNLDRNIIQSATLG